MEPPLTPFGTRLLQAIHEAGWTQTSFETAAGFVRGRISRLLTRPQTKFDNDVLRLLRDMLDVRLDWLIWGDGPMRDPHPPPAVDALRYAQRLGTPYKLLLEVRKTNEEKAIAEAWDAAQWLVVYQAAGAAQAHDRGTERAAKRTAAWQKKRAKRYHEDVAAVVEAKRVAEGAAAEAADVTPETTKVSSKTG